MQDDRDAFNGLQVLHTQDPVSSDYLDRSTLLRAFKEHVSNVLKSGTDPEAVLQVLQVSV